MSSYDDFMKWRTEKKIKSLSENVFIVYCNELSKKLQPSTLWSTYSMLKTTVNARHSVNLKDFTKLIAFLERLSHGFKSKKSKVFTAQQVETFLKQAPNELFLAIKIVAKFRLVIQTCQLRSSVEMSGYSQPGVKRQKVREIKDVDFFQGIDKIEYNNMASPTDTSMYRYYSCSERVHTRPMEDWLKCSVSLTEFRMNGNDKTRTWDDHTNSLDSRKRCIKALFDLLHKLGLKYWTALDSDLVEWEDRGQWDDMVEFVNELAGRFQVRLLWLAPDLHNNTRYTSGAMTSPDASTFIHAASQIKRCLEMSQRLNAENFLLWPSREGYDAIFLTDVTREIKLFAKLLKMTAEYKDRLNYRCQLLIMPYCGKGGKVHNYMWDVTSCLYFLKSYNLERFYKVCSAPGHHMYMASVYNMLGGITITNEFDPYNSKKLTLMMKSIVDQGSAPPGGINLKLYRRATDLRGIVSLYLKYVDALARALRLAASIVGEQVLSKHVQQRYVSYQSGLGLRLASGDVSMEECEEHHKKTPNQHEPTSKCEHIEIVFQRCLETCDHI